MFRADGRRIACHFPQLLSLLVCACLICAASTTAAASLDKAWELFLSNKPKDALDAFEKSTRSGNAAASAAAYRGMSAVEAYLGRLDASAVSLLKAYEQDHDMRYLAACMGPLVGWSRHGADGDDGYVRKQLQKTLRKRGLFVGNIRDMYLSFLVRTGELKEAGKVAEGMGTIHTWYYLGPFDNISNSGFNSVYAPEREIDFAKTYPGKDGNQVRWHKLQNRSPSGWVFLENHTTGYNAVNYFYCSVTSKDEQEVYLSFGASGTFKVFLNGTVVLQDSVFRNTGVDAFMQPVTLRKGTNAVLVKLGHETASELPGRSGMANFCLRLLDSSFEPAEDISFGCEAPGRVAAPPRPELLRNAPVFDSIVSFLQTRLKRDSSDMETVYILASYYNGHEETDRAQLLLERYLRTHPGSSLLHVLLGEALMRAGKSTEARVHLAKAYDACNLTNLGWERQMESVAGKGNPRKTLAFLESSPSEFKHSPSAELARLIAYAATENRAEAVACLTRLEKQHAHKGLVATVLFSIYANQGEIDKAAALLQAVLERNRGETDYWVLLAKAHLQRGRIDAARDALMKATQYSPNDPTPWQVLAQIHFMQKNFDEAVTCTDRILALRPADAEALMLKGNALAAANRTDDAIAVFQRVIDNTSADHLAYESIRQLQKRPSLESMTPLPDVDSLIEASATWADTLDNNSAILAYIRDVYYYPSHASRSRTFLVVKPLTQRGIEIWHEFVVPHNTSYQLYTINRALTRTKDGDEVEADVEGYKAVFTSLEPGDIVVLEYELRDYYPGKMAGMVWGSHLFTPSKPVFDSRLRLVVPEGDTIPYRIHGSEVSCSTTRHGDYRVTELTAPPSSVRASAEYVPEDHPSYPKVVYSTFGGWNEIARWYSGMVGHRTRPVIELTRLADSLFGGAKSDAERLQRVHDYMKRSINYSFVPFRQSGWVPQEASAVLATRIGDCKDMATLAKSLLDVGGVDSRLVLVNSDEHLFHDHAYIGPNFDHCILAAFIDNDTTFVDFTASNSSLGSLPWGVQGTMALIVDSSSSGLFLLPKDSPEQRCKQRTVTIELDSSGAMRRSASTVRSGVMAAGIRAAYRFLTQKERRNQMTKTLSRDYPDVTLDSLVFENIDSLSDSLSYRYAYTVRDAVDRAGYTAVVAVNLPDRVDADDFPALQDREWPIDMHMSPVEIGTWNMVAELRHPRGWKLLDLPRNVKLQTKRAAYTLSFERTGANAVRITRTMQTRYDSVFTPEEFAPEAELLKQVVKADDVKLVFRTP